VHLDCRYAQTRINQLDQYREIVQKLLQDYAAFSRDDQEVETELIFDMTRDHYLIPLGLVFVARIMALSRGGFSDIRVTTNVRS
jgi:hypothetical protein